MIGVYVVTGRRQYRGHMPGTKFEAKLDPAAAKRAIDRGDITLVDTIQPTVEPGFRLPQDWPIRVSESGERVSSRR